MTVGNDVVDLADPETRLDRLHPRWGDRVFAASEQAALDRASATRPTGTATGERARHRLHWALWAAKESAYKARKRAEPEAVFSPREFVVELSALPHADGGAQGRVVHRGEAFAVEVRVEGACVHAVARRANATGVPAAGRPIHGLVVKAVAVAGDDPTRDVRRLAASAVAEALRVDAAQLDVTGRPPVVRHDGGPVDATVSLSHHGRFVAFAGLLPRARSGRRRSTARGGR